ncbi:MAG: polyhydroxyalkanoate synthesis repressor PhaR [Alphaproteobacteria bacterium]|jgi:polyhydroxyalkanoate synthesis repressor PhaR|nr:polyhydroxyalkanoate synthesis repressor PhaR [Alphaproteobacteria bacterium]
MAAKSSADTTGAPAQPPIVIKKYANRRLYNTSSSSYVTLEELAHLLRAGKEFVVFDAKSGDEITRSVLTQIILEEDSKGRNVLPVTFLRQLIGFYDENMPAMLPRYLEATMDHFIQNQEQMQRYFEGTMGRFFPVNQLNDMTRQNMALLQQATSMFAPFAAPKDDDDAASGESEGRDAVYEAQQREIQRLQQEVVDLKERLARAEGTDTRTKHSATGTDGR